MSPAKPRRRYDWYTISSETIRGWMLVIFFSAAALVGWKSWGFIKHELLLRDLTFTVEEARGLLDSLEGEAGLDEHREQYDSAREDLRLARELATDGRLDEALRRAERSRVLLQQIFGALRDQGAASAARFIAVRGGVEYRRGDRGPWQPARGRVALQPGDYVKTSASGSAEIMAADGAVYTVRSDTVILVGESPRLGSAGGERTLNVEFGWVDLSTAASGSRVTTPEAEARVQRDSDAVISYDQEERVSRFAAYRGELEVSSSSGQRQEVGALEQVVQRGPRLSVPIPLPSAPVPIEPADNYEADLSRVSEVVLRWEPVSGAGLYALQVARDRLFVKNIIDVENRSRPMATLGLRGEGIFVWRVAAIGREGVKGPWSATRRFRVSGSSRAEAAVPSAPSPSEETGL